MITTARVGALVVDLTGDEVLPELERLSRALENWDDLVGVYERIDHLFYHMSFGISIRSGKYKLSILQIVKCFQYLMKLA